MPVNNMKINTPQLIVLEGLDGSGKDTQSQLLTNRLREASDKPVLKISYPDYSSQSSALVKMYLAGEMGTIEQVNVYAASSCYALDRYINYVNHWKGTYEAGGIIVADRYTTSNIIYQMSKIPLPQRKEYLNWLIHYEYELLCLPRPTTVIYLDMHPKISQMLLHKRYDGDDTKKDIHERNLQFLTACRETALASARTMKWKVITCFNKEHEPLPIQQIAELVWKSCF
jgi:dTMP kinase